MVVSLENEVFSSKRSCLLPALPKSRFHREFAAYKAKKACCSLTLFAFNGEKLIHIVLLIKHFYLESIFKLVEQILVSPLEDFELGLSMSIDQPDMASSSNVTSVTHEMGSHDHDYLCLTKNRLYDELCISKQENQRLQHKIGLQNRRINLLRNQIKSLQSGNLPKTLRKKVISEELKGKFSQAQIEMICDKKKRFFSKKWSNSDYAAAMKLRCISSKALMHVRKNHVPLPSVTTLRQKFNFIHLSPGIIKPAI